MSSPSPPTRQDILDLENDALKSHTHGANGSKRFEKMYRTQLATTVGSFMSILIAHPLDTVKSKLQVKYYRGFLDCARSTYKTDGAAGFYRGVMAPLASVTLVRIISMSVYQKSKYRYSEYISKNYGIDPLVSANTPGEYPGLATIACFSAAGATAGFWATFVSCPFELTKVSAQLSSLMAEAAKKGSSNNSADRAIPNQIPMTSQGKVVSDILNANLLGKENQKLTGQEKEVMKIAGRLKVKASPNIARPKLSSLQLLPDCESYDKGILRTATTIVQRRGLPGLYTGMGLHLFRDTIGSAIYFATYETGKQALNVYRGDTTPTSPVSVVGAGALCGITSWILIFPIDTAKTMYQKRCLMASREEKIEMPRIQWFSRRMYRGLGVSMARSVVTSAIFFSAFEATKKHINGLEDNPARELDVA